MLIDCWNITCGIVVCVGWFFRRDIKQPSGCAVVEPMYTCIHHKGRHKRSIIWTESSLPLSIWILLTESHTFIPRPFYVIPSYTETTHLGRRCQTRSGAPCILSYQPTTQHPRCKWGKLALEPLPTWNGHDLNELDFISNWRQCSEHKSGVRCTITWTV